MKIQFLILFAFLSPLYYGQTFSEKWIADSLGETGLRQTHVNRDSAAKVFLINGINVNGYKEPRLIALPGEPNVYGTFQYEHGVGLFRQHTHRTRRTLIYYLRGKNSTGNSNNDCLTFVVRKKKIVFLNRRYLQRFEEHKFLGYLLPN